VGANCELVTCFANADQTTAFNDKLLGIISSQEQQGTVTVADDVFACRAEDEAFESVIAMRGDDDEVGFFYFGKLDDGLAGVADVDVKFELRQAMLLKELGGEFLHMLFAMLVAEVAERDAGCDDIERYERVNEMELVGSTGQIERGADCMCR